LKSAMISKAIECETNARTVEEDLEGGRVLAVVGDDNARAADDLAGLALTVNLLRGCQRRPTAKRRVWTHGKTGPLAEDLGVRDLDELDVVLGAESLDELEVLGWDD
jgi:hypothetical protein